MSGNVISLSERKGLVSNQGEPDILSPTSQPIQGTSEPGCFRDLNLDQVGSAMNAGREEFRLLEYFWSGPADSATILYRQTVMRDLERPEVASAFRSFCDAMQEVRAKQKLQEKLYYASEKSAWYLVQAELYTAAFHELLEKFEELKPASPALEAVHAYLVATSESGPFPTLDEDAKRIQSDLDAIRYKFHVNEGSVSVKRYDGEPDYGKAVSRTFERFRARDVALEEFKLREGATLNHIEANILEGVRRLFPDVFAQLDEFQRDHPQIVDPIVERFDRQLRFYFAYMDYIEPLKRAGLPFCYPEVGPSKAVEGEGVYDIALARKLAGEKKETVLNDFEISGAERIFVVSGPNQGGKTTFARMLGQIHYLGALGLPVPGRRAKLFHFDRIYAHFEREENMHNLRGKLQDDLVRIHEVLSQATDRSIVIMNEIFTSTTLRDAMFLGTEVLRRIISIGALAVCVTFIDELSRLGKETTSWVSTIDPDNPAERTFKVIRKPADGMAHAMAIAAKYGLTKNALKKRLSK